jgi:hypothetical protein
MPTRRRFLQTAVGAATVLFTTRPAAAAPPPSLVEWFDDQMKDPVERARMERFVAVARASGGDAALALKHYDGTLD